VLFLCSGVSALGGCCIWRCRASVTNVAFRFRTWMVSLTVAIAVECKVREGRIVTSTTFEKDANLFPARRAAPTSSFPYSYPIEDKHEAMQLRTYVMVYICNAGDFAAGRGGVAGHVALGLLDKTQQMCASRSAPTPSRNAPLYL
jgi:hypothetical protein